MKNTLRNLALLVFLSLLCGYGNAQITFTRGSTTYTVGRTWLNISETNYFDSYLQSNIFLENPSMQSLEVSQTKAVLSGVVGASCASNSCQFTTQGDYDGAATNYWVGFKGIWACKAGSGTAPGNCGLGTNQYNKSFTVTANTANTGSGQTTYTYTMDDGSTPVVPTANDSITLNSPETWTTPNSDFTFGAFGWDKDTTGSGTVTVDTTSGDLPPSLGIGVGDAHQCIRLHNASGSDTAGVKTFFDSTGTLYYNFNGTYTGKVYLSILSGSPTSVEFWGNRGAGVSWSQSASLSGASWADRTISVTLSEANTAAGGTVNMGIRLHGAGDVCIVNARMTNDADTGTYRNTVVADLTALKLGGIRFNTPPGSHLINLITPQGYRRPSSFWGSNHPVVPAVQQGLVESLNLAEQLGLPKVSFVAQVNWTPTDFANLMEFLGGNSGTTWGAKRVALGHPTPYTQVFQLLRIEGGNEVWNCGLAAGYACYNLNQSGGFWNYPTLVKNQCKAMKDSSSYSSVIDCAASIITDPNSGPFEADQIAAADPTHQIDSMNINQYMQVGPTTCGQFGQYIPAWVNPLANMQTSPATQSGFGETAREITANGYIPYTYEFQNHTIQGSCTQAQITGYAEGQGFGLTTAMAPQYANKVLGVHDNAFWQYTQISAAISTTGGATTNNIWGIVTGTAGGAYTAFRGSGYSMQQANACMGTSPVGVNGTNSGVPTFNFSASNNVNALSNVPYLQEFHYSSGTQRCTIVYNINPTTAYPYTIAGTDAPTGTVTYTTYSSTGGDVQDSNEGANPTLKVLNTTTTGAAGSITIQPHTAVSAIWTAGTPPPTCDLASNTPQFGVNFLPGSSRHITFVYGSGCPSGTATTADHSGTTLTLHGTFTDFYTSSNSLIQFTNCNSPFDRWMNGAVLPIISTTSTQVQVQFTNPNTFTGAANTCTLTEVPKVAFSQTTTSGSVTATLTPNSSGLPDVLVVTSGVNGHCTATGSAPSVTLSSTQAMTITATSLEDGTKTAAYPILQCGKTTTVDIPGNTRRQAFINQPVYLTANVFGDADKRIAWSTTCGTLSSVNTRNTTITSGSSQTCTVTATSVSDGTKTATVDIRFNGARPSYYFTPPNKTEIQACDITDPRFTTIRQVGPSKAFTTINAAVTQTLPANLMVAIYNEDVTGTSPTTYAEWFMADDSVYICGVPDSTGHLPVVDGDLAKGPPWVTNSAWFGNGIANINHNTTCNGLYAGGSCGPIGVTIANLAFKHANSSYQFYLPDGVTLANWGDSAAISVRTGQHLSVIGNSCDTTSMCPASYSAANGNWADATQGLDDSSNYCTNYGTSGSALDHCHYIQTLSVNVSRNLLGPVISGDQGSGIKNRSIGWQMAFNRISTGPSRGSDGVEVQDWSQYVDLSQYYSSGGPYSLGDTFGVDGVVGLQEALYEDNYFGNVYDQAGNEHNIGDHVQGTVPNAFWAMSSRYSHHSNWFYNTFYQPGVVIDTSAQQQVDFYMLPEFWMQNNVMYDSNGGSVGGFAINTSSAFTAHMQTNLFFTGSVVNTAPRYGGQISAGESFGWSGNWNDGWGIGSRPLDPHLFTTTSTAADYRFTSTAPFDLTTFAAQGAALGAATALTNIPAQFSMPFNAVNLNGVATIRTSLTAIGAVESAAPPTQPIGKAIGRGKSLGKGFSF